MLAIEYIQLRARGIECCPCFSNLFFCFAFPIPIAFSDPSANDLRDVFARDLEAFWIGIMFIAYCTGIQVGKEIS
jgi:hypothetical protein